MTTGQTLARIDDTLDDWDQWDGHSPDAARWRGESTAAGFEAVCCHAGRVAFPTPCPWHGAST